MQRNMDIVSRPFAMLRREDERRTGMSIIVRMEMPSRCYDCDFANGVTCMATGGVYGRDVPKMTWIKTRPSWCPIIGELPEQKTDAKSSNVDWESVTIDSKRDRFA